MVRRWCAWGTWFVLFRDFIQDMTSEEDRVGGLDVFVHGIAHGIAGVSLSRSVARIVRSVGSVPRSILARGKVVVVTVGTGHPVGIIAVGATAIVFR